MPVSPFQTRASLILRLRDAEDAAAWDEFVELYSPVIHRAATQRGIQSADADNIVQEVLLSVSRSVGQWLERSDRGSFRSWLLRIARNEAFDLINARDTRAIGTDGEKAQQVLAVTPDRPDVCSILDFEYERALFHKAAETVRGVVAEHTWQAFWLTRVEGLSVDQAAQRLKVRPGNIYFARSRVMAKIKDVVQQYGVDND